MDGIIEGLLYLLTLKCKQNKKNPNKMSIMLSYFHVHYTTADLYSQAARTAVQKHQRNK